LPLTGLVLYKNVSSQSLPAFKRFIRRFTAPIDTEAGDLSNIPNFFIRQSIFMSFNTIVQAIADVIIEALILLSLVSFKIPFRLEFLFLTAISTVTAYLTLVGIHGGKMNVTRNTLVLGFLVESSLVLVDIYLLFNTDTDFRTVFLIRLPSTVLTSTIIYIIANELIRGFYIQNARPNFWF